MPRPDAAGKCWRERYVGKKTPRASDDIRVVDEFEPRMDTNLHEWIEGRADASKIGGHSEAERCPAGEGGGQRAAEEPREFRTDFPTIFFVHRPAVTGSFTARRPTAFTHADAPFKMTSFFLKRQPCERRLGRFASLGFVESHSCAFVSIRGLSQFESPLTSAPPATGESACLP